MKSFPDFTRSILTWNLSRKKPSSQRKIARTTIKFSGSLDLRPFQISRRHIENWLPNIIQTEITIASRPQRNSKNSTKHIKFFLILPKRESMINMVTMLIIQAKIPSFIAGIARILILKISSTFLGAVEALSSTLMSNKIEHTLLTTLWPLT